MNKLALSVATLVVASGLSVVNILPTDEIEEKPSPIDIKMFDQENLRKAWMTGTCSENSIMVAKNCERKWDRRGYCVCLTRTQELLLGEADKVNVNGGSKWRFMVCRPLPGQTGSIVVLIQNPEDVMPKNYQCTMLAPLVTSNKSIPSYVSSLETALESKCGWPVTSGSWGCCPRCVVWDVGCPPCPDACKYGEKWPKFTEECKAGL
jgi:hypothetical protein